jgi:hypothetical protein
MGLKPQLKNYILKLDKDYVGHAGIDNVIQKTILEDFDTLGCFSKDRPFEIEVRLGKLS